jgi:hypothetical protein
MRRRFFLKRDEKLSACATWTNFINSLGVKVKTPLAITISK